MREIKFRAWDKIEMQMIDESCGFASVVDVFNHVEEFEDNDCILMQYTGLKDKNEKYIYENDIVERNTIYDDGSAESHVGVITYCEKNCHFYSRSIKNEISRGIGETDGVTHEVIGNIYENPELLTN